MVKTIICLFFVLISTYQLQAQDGEKRPTDRFGVSYTPYVLEKNNSMLETGTKMTFKREDLDEWEYLKERLLTLPEFRIRYGLLYGVELQLFSSYSFQFRKTNFETNEKQKGLGELKASVKYNFLKDKKNWPDATVIFMYDYDGFDWRGGDTINQSQIRFAFQNNISEKFDLKYNLAINWDWDKYYYSPQENYYFISVSPVWNITDQFSALVEGYAFLRKDKKGNEIFVGSALAYDLNSHSALDFNFGIQVNEYYYQTSLWSVGLGYSKFF